MAIYKKVLLAVDGSPTSDQALAQIANFVTTDAIVRVVYVAEDPLTTYPVINEDFTYLELLRDVTLEEGKKVLEKAESSLRSQGYQVETKLIDLRATGQDIPGAIKADGEKWGTDLTVLGTHGRRGVRRMFLGSVAENFVRMSTRPVLLVHSIEPAAAQEKRDKGDHA
ncbi:universal stress family protein [Collimonas arenae]|uniref:Universal stress family protein n=2 Tax=Collimonas arenae TaxID=279058 RepID=A0A127QJ28_9BURK|nr:universal stress protein [Collimonas arenae]AMP00108.1 universal stress family protein [Collimonas arenae]AMP10006.1 universal stress family protein [Collimonas arenae]